jgi:hypothetical protein
MDFEARGSQGPQAVLNVRRTTRKRVPADDEATKKGTNPNSGTAVDHKDGGKFHVQELEI